jgi:glycosyltransferase involved in cell wall biosynthesis
MHLVIVHSIENDGPRLTAEINGTLLPQLDVRNRVDSSSETGLIHLIHASGSAALGPYYQGADVFVTNPVCELLQTSFLEEAAANALPLLAPLCEGSLEILKDGVTALLHKDPLDVSGLAANLIALDTRTASGALKAQDMGRAGCEALREKGALDTNRFAQRFFDLLHANLGN